MKLVALLGIVVLVAALGAWASEPGQPLDCSDWVFLQPGYSCGVYSPFGAAISRPMHQRGANRVIDNAGALITVVGSNDSYPQLLNDYVEVRRYNGLTETVIGFVQTRGGDHIVGIDGEAGIGYDSPELAGGIEFDAVNGRLLVPLASSGRRWIAAIDGFAKLLDIFETYTPSTSTLSFRVPAIPEGMGGADYFDTYWGDLSTVGSWWQAHGLQCHCPAAPPARGDYLTVPDTLPTPQPGHGYYYVTATTYQGQTRYGRKTSGGMLSGRDPAVLPACASEITP
ncbi:MAG: hypothetical protein LAO51_01645 [Acidobacteriia bacterium]|nr:hypothetical protein [Terriglobia bacterium]